MILCRVTAQPKTSQSLWEGANLVQYAGQTFVKHEKHIYSLLHWSDRPASNIDRWYFVLLVQHVRLQQFCLVHIELESFIWQVLHSWFCSVLWWWHTLAGDTNDDGGATDTDGGGAIGCSYSPTGSWGDHQDKCWRGQNPAKDLRFWFTRWVNRPESWGMCVQIHFLFGLFDVRNDAANATNHLVSCFINMSRPRPGPKFKVHTNCSAYYNIQTATLLNQELFTVL